MPKASRTVDDAELAQVTGGAGQKQPVPPAKDRPGAGDCDRDLPGACDDYFGPSELGPGS